MANPSPEITFQVNLELNTHEVIGPITNPRNVAVLHPDRHVNLDLQDEARDSIAQREDHRSTWLPGLTAAENIALKNDGQFTAYGQRAIYLRDSYTVGDNPVLVEV
jgi:hypothetical protein